MNVPPGDAVRTALEAAEKALTPFAKWADSFGDPSWTPDDYAHSASPTVGELRTAREALSVIHAALATPAKEWRCFHCDEAFTTVEAAREHFGVDMDYEPGCMLKLTEEEKDLQAVIHRLQTELARYHEEDSDKDRQMAALKYEHGRALISEEEKGYARGLADGRALAAKAAMPEEFAEDKP